MEVRLNRNDKPLIGTQPILKQIKLQLDQFANSFQQKLAQNPEDFCDIESNIHNEFRKLADHFVAGILAETAQPEAFTENARKK